MALYYGNKSGKKNIGEFAYDISKGINPGLQQYVALKMQMFSLQLPFGYTIEKEIKNNKIIYSVYESIMEYK